MRNISLKSLSARLSVTLLLLMGSMSASAQYYLNVYEKTGSNNQYEISNLDSVSISDVKEYIPVLTQLSISQSQVSLETGESATLTVKGYDGDGAEMTLENLKWKSSDYSVASVDENGVVRTYQSGNAVITALVGDVSATCSVVVTDHIYTIADVVKIAIDMDALKLETGQSASIGAMGFSINGIEIALDNVDWKSSNTSVASIDGSGLIKTYTSGVAEIIAFLGTISDTCVVTVTDHVYTLDEVVEIIIDRDTLNFETGESGKLSVRGFAADGVEIPLSNIVWESSDYSHASVDVNGNVRTYKSGSADIVALLGNVTDTCTVIIKDHIYTLDEVVKLSLDKVALNVETGDGDSLCVRGFAADGVEIPLSNILWKTDDESVAIVTDNGVVKTLSSGQALVIALLGDIADTCKVTVVDHVYTLDDVKSVSLSKDTIIIDTNQFDTLSVVGLTADGKEIPLENILWKSNNTSVASIKENGAIRPYMSGSAILTATFGQYTDTCVIIVVDHVYTIDEVNNLTTDEHVLSLETGDIDTLIVKGYNINWYYGTHEIPLDDHLTWMTSNPSVATVDGNGVINAIKKGNAIITASLGELSVTFSVTVRDKYVAIDVTIDSLAKSGVYMGVMGFNKQLYAKPISILNTDSKNAFDTFVDSMEMKNGTLLCYAVDNAVDSLGSTVLPDNLSKVAVVTFTDGLDQGSIDMIEAVTGQYYDSDDEYLDEIKRKISTYSLAGIPITAYSVGVKGSDVKDLTKFQSTLKQLASSNEYAIEVNNMSELNKTFKAIADTLNRARNYQTVPIVMPGLSNGTRVRFTFDNVADANKSTLYIEGTYNRRERTLTDVKYYGMSSTSGSVVAGEISEVIFTKFTFESILTKDNTFINKSFINEWYKTSDGAWQVNSEFDPDQQPDIELVQSSMLIMLVLDCSSSLGDEFATVQSAAKNFISTMYTATGGNENNGSENSGLNDNFSLYSTTPVDLSLAVSIDGVRYFLTQEQYQKANLSKAIVEGITVVLGSEGFIISLQDEPINYIKQQRAVYYYENLPTMSQGKIISARWSYINDALKTFGGNTLSSRFWTNSSSSNSCYAVYQGGGELYSAAYDGKYPVRLVKSTSSITPILWRNEDDLKLVAYKGTERSLFTPTQWENVSKETEYDVRGILVTMGNTKFILSLQDEKVDAMLQSYAKSTYNTLLPSAVQGRIISARWSYINNALSAFGGDRLSNRFWTNYTSGSSYYEVYDGGGELLAGAYDGKYPVRLVYPFFDSIQISDKTLDLYLGRSYNLTASLMDDGNSVSGSVNWSSNNPSVVSVDNNGAVTGVNIGTAIITAFCDGITANCVVTVIAPPVAEAVDLGLSVKWASFNLGATRPEESGLYYAWGETEYKTNFSWSTYKWCKGTASSLTKYCNNSSYGNDGFTDVLSELTSEDDVAHIKWGGNWRMPTPEEINELLDNCTWSYTTQNGVGGFLLTSKKDGYTDRSIFLPAAGYNSNNTIWGTGQKVCCYLSNTLDSTNTTKSVGLYHHQDASLMMSSLDRDSGCSVRPVCP